MSDVLGWDRIVALASLLLLQAGCHLIFPFGVTPVAEAGAEAGSADASGPSGAWCKPGWSYRKPLTLAKVGEDLTDFPVLVSLEDEDLAARARADGRDVAFCLPGGAPLAYEREAFTSAKGRLVAWVKVPRLRKAGQTVLHLYYGNAGAADQQRPQEVWSNGYLGVWHLGASPLQALDSTANKHHGTIIGQLTAASVVTGQIGGAYHLDGIDDRIVASAAALKPTGALTVSAWIRLDPKDTNYDDDDLISATSGSKGDYGWDLSFDKDPSYDPTGIGCRAISFRGSYDGSTGFSIGWTKICPPPLGGWHLAAGVFKPSVHARFFLDGVMEKETQQVGAALHATTKWPFTIGSECHDSGGRNYYMGEMDEVRVAKVARSKAWIAAAHANQRAPGTFVKPGAQQAPPPQGE